MTGAHFAEIIVPVAVLALAALIYGVLWAPYLKGKNKRKR